MAGRCNCAPFDVCEANLDASLGLGERLSASNLEYLIQQVRQQGWCVLDAFFSSTLIDSLCAEVASLLDSDMQQAGVGRKYDHQIVLDTRRDCIQWIDGESPTREAFLTVMEALRVTLNRALLLGLFDYEAHFARYYENGFYEKHLDAFKGQSNRVLSTVLYLNDDWVDGNGGELVIFDEHNPQLELLRIAPKKGRFVVFLSEDFYHQVNVSKTTRHSIAGWFRVNNSSHAQPDPSR